MFSGNKLNFENLTVAFKSQILNLYMIPNKIKSKLFNILSQLE